MYQKTTTGTKTFYFSVHSHRRPAGSVVLLLRLPSLLRSRRSQLVNFLLLVTRFVHFLRFLLFLLLFLFLFSLLLLFRFSFGLSLLLLCFSFFPLGTFALQ